MAASFGSQFETGQVQRPSKRPSKAVFCGYTLIAEYDSLPNKNGERFWRSRVLNYQGIRINFPRATAWASQAEAEQHAEIIARYSAQRLGVILPHVRPKWN